MRIPKDQLKQRMAAEAPELDPDMLDRDPMSVAPEGAIDINAQEAQAAEELSSEEEEGNVSD